MKPLLLIALTIVLSLGLFGCQKEQDGTYEEWVALHDALQVEVDELRSQLISHKRMLYEQVVVNAVLEAELSESMNQIDDQILSNKMYAFSLAAGNARSLDEKVDEIKDWVTDSLYVWCYGHEHESWSSGSSDCYLYSED
jgi:hypothetical protein